MIKLIKWVYRLAQQTERQRIASILNEHRRYREPDYMAKELFGKNIDRLSDKRKDTLKFEQAVDYRVNDIIDNITRPQSRDMESYSLLYPKEGK